MITWLTVLFLSVDGQQPVQVDEIRYLPNSQRLTVVYTQGGQRRFIYFREATYSPRDNVLRASADRETIFKDRFE